MNSSRTSIHININGCTYHRFVPNKTHSLLHSIGPLGYKGKVVLPYSLLRGAVSTMSTAHNLQIPTEERRLKGT